MLRWGEWGDPRHAESLDAWARAAPLLDRILDAAEADALGLPNLTGAGEVGTNFEAMVPIRRCAQVLSVGMRAAAEARDWAALEARTAAALRLGGLLLERALLIDAVVGWGIRGIAMHELRTIVVESELPADVADRLADAISQECSAPLAMDHLLQGERRFSQAALGNHFSRAGLPLLWTVSEESFMHRALDQERLLGPSGRFVVLLSLRLLVKPCFLLGADVGDAAQDSFNAPDDCIIRHALDSVAVCFDEGLATGVGLDCGGAFVGSSINFDHEEKFRAAEIGDEWSDRVLAAELVTERAIAKMTPEEAFGEG